MKYEVSKPLIKRKVKKKQNNNRVRKEGGSVGRAPDTENIKNPKEAERKSVN